MVEVDKAKDDSKSYQIKAEKLMLENKDLESKIEK